MAGLCAADHMYELDAPLFELAAELEGHPDNVAAALLGGFVIASDAPVRVEPPAGLEAVLAIPRVRGAYRSGQGGDSRLGPARRRGSQRRRPASLLVLGLARGDLSLIGRGLTDALHQPHRRSLYERSMELVERGVRARRARRDDLGRRADGAVLVALGADGGAGRAAALGGAGLRGAPGDLRARRGGRE